MPFIQKIGHVSLFSINERLTIKIFRFFCKVTFKQFFQGSFLERKLENYFKENSENFYSYTLIYNKEANMANFLILVSDFLKIES